MALGIVAPFPKHQFFDNNGDPASGYQLFCYEAGTNSKLDTYSEAVLIAQNINSNPIVLDAAGRCSLFLLPQTYKFVLAPANDTDPPVSPIWTIDNVQTPAPFNVNVDIEGLAGENLLSTDCVFMADGTGGLT